uniref:Uncharacterized protein n=1 Tax=Mantoniella antarctica TaxID=81844 RepID=A0A7S0S7R1_9CHLO|mmetsp:Transcript_1137/g.2489  ORF Transcript_1137/g.2489 Transcript_1137/m.2489 type:complete len:150 (+) Transcript_1137:140-589(+)
MGSNTASLQFMITNAMKGTLIDELGFLPEEVEVMKPEVAKEVIEKRMNRPFGKRPMPDAWKRDYDPDGGADGSRGGLNLGPVGDLFRSLFYMTLMAGVGLGLGCVISPEVRAGVKQAAKDLKRELQGKKKKKKRSRVSSAHGRGATVRR